MEFRSGRRRISTTIAPLLIALLLCGAAAQPFSAKQAYRDARASTDRNDVAAALAKTEAALTRLGNANDEWTWALRMLKGELLFRVEKREQGLAILKPELPAGLQTSEAAVRRLVALAYTDGKPPLRALEIATKYQPALLPDVHLVLAMFRKDVEANARAATELAKRAGRPLPAALAQGVLAHHYADEGRFAESIEIGEHALANLRKLNLPARLSAACGNLGWPYYELGEYERAAELFTCAESAAAQAGAVSERIKWLNQFGNIHLARRDYKGAEQYYKQALSLGRDTDALTNLARVFVETGRFDEARAANNEALALKKEEKDRLRSLLVDAQIDARTGNTARAEKTLQTVLAADAKYATTRWEAEARLGELYSRMQRNREAETHFRRAVDTAREARADIQNAELKLSFFNTVEEVFDAYVDFLVRQQRVPEALALTEVSRAQTLEEGLKIKSPLRAIDPRALAQQHGVTILCYWLGRDRSYVWTVTPSAISIAPLPADTTIESAADAYRRDLLAPGPRASLQGSGRRGSELYQMLVAPAVKGLPKNARVTIIADGRLHALSFDSLVVPGATPHYWLEDVILTNAGSLQLLAQPAGKPANQPSLLLVGNALTVDPHYPHLQNASKEMQLVAKHFTKRTVLDGAKATPAAYRSAATGGYDYLHFVAHGVATRTQPLDSAVILSPDAAKAYKLFARDIINQPLTARLVTISSCHGAGSRTYAGEGLVGLAWAFLRAGAEQVIAALWEANDSATPQLMDRMYASIRAGADPALALRDAKLSLVRSNSVYRNARYWAPFVLYSGS